jgi:electron transfer flavoprotein beta subunit
MGVNDAVLISGLDIAGGDTYATSYVLSMTLRKIGGFNLILCGKQAADGDTAQVGPGIATHLDLPQITYVRKIEAIDEKRIVAERLMETGYEVIEAPLPCVLTVVKEINEPRLPSLKGKIAAKKADIPVWGSSDIGADPARIGLEGSLTQVIKVFSPEPRSGGETLEGEIPDVTSALVEKLRDIVTGAAP